MGSSELLSLLPATLICVSPASSPIAARTAVHLPSAAAVAVNVANAALNGSKDMIGLR